MHEMSIVTNVVRAVVAHAERNNVERVIRVTLVVGELHDIVDDLMERCFRYLARGTVAENAALDLVKVPFKAQCTACQLVYPANLRSKETLVCPECASTDFRIFNGNEFIIRDIEVV